MFSLPMMDREIPIPIPSNLGLVVRAARTLGPTLETSHFLMNSVNAALLCCFQSFVLSYFSTEVVLCFLLFVVL